VIQIANRRDNAGGNDIAIFSGIKKNDVRNRAKEVKYHCRISRISAAANRCIAIGMLTKEFEKTSPKLNKFI
jgi:hypothetical protein